MIFHILSAIPDVFEDYFKSSILGRAQKNKLISIKTYNIRKWAKDKHKKIDDSPFGGGPGMVLKVGPIYKAVENIKSKTSKAKSHSERSSTTRIRVILFSTRGKKFDNKIAQRLSKYNNLILICGRYEGVDERVAKHIADEEISIGDFILSGGEIPAMVLVDSVSRFIPGVLGKKESLEELKGSYPTYTRPEVFSPDGKSAQGGSASGRKWSVPKVLLSGDHKKIEEWRGI
ncbi:MAG: tRNA (guanosine(37)-N1)-methyltransferase TrmD [Candidatus Paceibacterota bacterium]|jgi:tRNA (guanine37-N1)-methyltransferase